MSRKVTVSPIERKKAKVINDSCKRLNGQWLIPYPWIKDSRAQPDYREQVERKLVAMKRRLLPNIKNASAYDKEWLSPLCITSGGSETRIVFNSSAVYDGHKLNRVGPVYEFVCISFRTDNLNCFRAS